MTVAAASADDDPFGRRYEGATAVVNGVRLDIDAWLSAQAADDDTRARAALVVSELVSNAVQASPSRPFYLRACRRDRGAITLTVTNRAENAKIPPRCDWGPDDLLSPGGRGLAIVDSLCEEVTITSSSDGDVTVEATLGAAFG
jgi:anti-sigma regulatory factor (Ser/Thr protein kinase)